MTDQLPPTGSRMPILGPPSVIGRTVIVLTVVTSIVAIVLEFGLHANETLIFIVAATGILGLAWVVGLSTERLGALTGPQVGGILNATVGNIGEIIIAVFALKAGLIDLVKASITGSIIGNVLLVFGASVLIGGLRHGTQTFDAKIAGANAALLVLALVGLFVPAVFAYTTADRTQGTLTEESVFVALILMTGYVISLVYQFTNPKDTLGGHGEPAGHAGPPWSGKVAIVVLLAAAALLAVLSEILVGAISRSSTPSG